MLYGLVGYGERWLTTTSLGILNQSAACNFEFVWAPRRIAGLTSKTQHTSRSGLRLYAGYSLLPCTRERRCEIPVHATLRSIKYFRGYAALWGTSRHTGAPSWRIPATGRVHCAMDWQGHSNPRRRGTLTSRTANARLYKGGGLPSLSSSRVSSFTRHHQSPCRLLHDPSFPHSRIRHVSLHHAPLRLRACGCRVCFAGCDQRHRYRKALSHWSCKSLPPTLFNDAMLMLVHSIGHLVRSWPRCLREDQQGQRQDHRDLVQYLQ